MSKKRSHKHKHHKDSKEHSHHHKDAHHEKEKPKKKSRGFLKFLAFIIIISIIGGLLYLYIYQPELWDTGESWVREKVNMEKGDDTSFDEINYASIEPENEGIPEEFYEGHESEGGEISKDDAEAKMREEFKVEDGDVVMFWPEKIAAEEWIWENDMVLGPVGKLSSDGWLFWIDKQYGGMYPHPTYYIVVYGDGYVDVFVGSFTPMVGEDDWTLPGTNAKLIEGSLDIEGDIE